MGDVTDKEGKRIYRLYIYKIELRIKKILRYDVEPKHGGKD